MAVVGWVEGVGDGGVTVMEGVVEGGVAVGVGPGFCSMSPALKSRRGSKGLR